MVTFIDAAPEPPGFPDYTREELETDIREGLICTNQEWVSGVCPSPELVVPPDHWLLAVLEEADPQQVYAFRIVSIEDCKREWPCVAATAEANGTNLTLTFHPTGICAILHPARRANPSAAGL